jgi:hypothetical protein
MSSKDLLLPRSASKDTNGSYSYSSGKPVVEDSYAIQDSAQPEVLSEEEEKRRARKTLWVSIATMVLSIPALIGA